MKNYESKTDRIEKVVYVKITPISELAAAVDITFKDGSKQIVIVYRAQHEERRGGNLVNTKQRRILRAYVQLYAVICHGNAK